MDRAGPDRVSEYREIVKNLILEYAPLKPAYGEIEVETIFDETHDHYELLYTGWKRGSRIHGSVLHLDIKDGKIWIQHDGTAPGGAEELVSAGVPRDHIVLGFRPPNVRHHTSFAVG